MHIKDSMRISISDDGKYVVNVDVPRKSKGKPDMNAPSAMEECDEATYVAEDDTELLALINKHLPGKKKTDAEQYSKGWKKGTSV